MALSIEKYLDDIKDGIKGEYQYILKLPIEADGGKVTIASLETHFDMRYLDLDISLYGIEHNSDINLPSNANKMAVSYDFAKNHIFMKVTK